MPALTALLPSLLGLACVGGGERTYSFDTVDIESVDIWAQWGEVDVVSEERSDILIDYEGGGVGGHLMPYAEVVDGVLLFNADCEGACGGEVEVLVPHGLPIWVNLDAGEIDIHLEASTSVGACLGDGEIDITMPPGEYDLDVSVAIGELDLHDIQDVEGAEHRIIASVAAGELDVGIVEPD